VSDARRTFADLENERRQQRAFSTLANNTILDALHEEFGVERTLGYDAVVAAIKAKFGEDARMVMIPAHIPYDAPIEAMLSMGCLVIETGPPESPETVWSRELRIDPDAARIALAVTPPT